MENASDSTCEESENSQEGLLSFNESASFSKVTFTGQEALQDIVIKIISLYFLRSISTSKEFYIGSNLKGLDVFNSIVFRYVPNEKNNQYNKVWCICFNDDEVDTLYLHANDTESINLIKYLACISSIKHQFSDNIELHKLGSFEEFEYIVFTNAIFSGNFGDLSYSHVLNTGNDKELKGIPKENNMIINDLICYKTFLSKCIVNMNSAQEIIDEVNMLEASVNTRVLLDNLQMLKVRPTQEELQRLYSEVRYIDVNCAELLPKLHICSRQTADEDLTYYIKQEIKKLVATTKFGIDLSYLYLFSRIKKWWKSENYYLTNQSDIWIDFEKLLPFLTQVAEPLFFKIRNENINFFAYPTLEIKNCIMHHKVLNVMASCKEMLLTCLKLYQILEKIYFGKYLWISLELLVSKYKELFFIWQSMNYQILVVECRTDIEDCDTLSDEIYNLLLNSEQKLIIISVENNIFVTNLKHLFIDQFYEVKDEFKFIDLDDDSQMHLLQKEILFQGHMVPLVRLFSSTQGCKLCLNASTVCQLLRRDQPFVIGSCLPKSVYNFISRNLELSVPFDINILRSRTQTHVFAVSNILLSDLKKILNIENIDTFSVDNTTVNYNCKIFCFVNCLSETFKAFTAYFIDKHVHHFYFRDNILFWRQSKGDTKYLMDYVLLDYEATNSSKIWEIIEGSKCSAHIPETLMDAPKKFVLVTGEPGIGKSSLITNLAVKTKAKFPEHWVVYLNINNRKNFLLENRLEEYNMETVVDLIHEVIEDKRCSQKLIEYTLLKNSLENKGNIIIVCEGIDEVRPEFIPNVVRILEVFQYLNVGKLWVTASSHVESEVQKLFEVKYELQPFSADMQTMFLVSLIRDKYNSYEKEDIVRFVTTFQNMSSKSKYLQKLLHGNPLLCIIASELLEECFLDFLSTSTLKWPEKITFFDMYEKFMNLKLKDYCSKKLQVHESDSVSNQKSTESIVNGHILCALQTLYDSSELSELQLHYIQGNVSKFIAKAEKIGIVERSINGKPVFFHRTGAEYFVALWFSQNTDKCREFLRCRLLTPYFTTVLKFFDYLLTRGHELHSSIINEDRESIKNLLQFGIDVNGVDKGGRTALHLAVVHCRSLHHACYFEANAADSHCNPIVEILMNHSANSKIVDNVLLWRPIQYAIELRNWGAMDILLREQVDFNDVGCLKEKLVDNKFVQGGLLAACKKGYFNLVESFLMCGINISENIISCRDGLYNPLHIAARFGQLKLVRYLLSKKIKVSIKDKMSITPLHLAASEGMIEILAYLLQRGADLNCTDKDGNTPLNYAIFRNNFQTVIYIIEHYKCNINFQNKSGDTPLHHAVKTGDPVMVEYLLMQKVQIDTGNKEGNTALHLAIWLGTLPIVKILVEYGAGINIRNKYGETPLSQNAGGGNLEIVKTLIENGADVNNEDNYGNSALHWVARQNNEAILDYFIKSGANLNIQNHFGNTPIHCAVQQGCLDTVKLLMCAGCDTEIKNKSGCTVKHMKSRSPEISNLFI